MKKRNHDWEQIEKEYRLGQKSIRCIASAHKISHTAINKRAKKEDWLRDKTNEVREKTRAALVSNKEVSKKDYKVSTPSRNDIDTAVKVNIKVITGHRKDISKGRSLVSLLQNQLEDAAKNREDYKDLIIDETKGSSPDGKPNLKRRASMLRAVSLSTHSGILRDLSVAIKNLIPLERQAFGIDEDPHQFKAVDEIEYIIVKAKRQDEAPS